MNNLALLKDEIEFSKIESRFTELTDKDTFTKELSFAVQAFDKNTYLSSSTVNSKLSAILNVAQTGLTLNPIKKLAYLIPRYNNTKKCVECILEPSYQGLVKLVTDTGSIKNIYAHIVYDGDEFQEHLGTEISLTHIPKRKSKEIVLFYSVAVLQDGSKMVEVMDKADIDEIMEISESYKAYKSNKTKSCIWVEHYGEMGKKTVIKRLVKYVPKTEKWDKLSTAIHIGESDFSITEGQYMMIENLLSTSTYEHEQRASIERNLHDYSRIEASNLIQDLQNNQLDAISSGMSYNQTDIKNKLKE